MLKISLLTFKKNDILNLFYIYKMIAQILKNPLFLCIILDIRVFHIISWYFDHLLFSELNYRNKYIEKIDPVKYLASLYVRHKYKDLIFEYNVFAIYILRGNMYISHELPSITRNDKPEMIQIVKKYPDNTLKMLSEKEYLELIKFLFINKKVPDNINLLLLAIQFDHTNIIKYLCMKNIPVTPQIFEEAIKFSNLQTIKYLYKRLSEPINNKFYHDQAITYGKWDIALFFSKKGKCYHSVSYDVLWDGCQESNLSKIKYAITYGHYVDVYGGLPLIKACKKGDSKMVKFLIKKGADLLKNRDAFNQAVTNGNFKIVRFLLGKGISVDNFALYEAAEKGYLKLTKLFLKKSKHFNRIDYLTAAFKTLWVPNLENNHFKILKIYIKKAADNEYIFNSIFFEYEFSTNRKIVNFARKYLLKHDKNLYLKNYKID